MIAKTLYKTGRRQVSKLANLSAISLIGLSFLALGSPTASAQRVDPRGLNRCWSNAIEDWVDGTFFDGVTCQYLACPIPPVVGADGGGGGGAANPALAGSPPSGSCAKSQSGPCSASAIGLASWSVDEPIINLRLEDTPLNYPTSRGRQVRFALFYKNTLGSQGTNDNNEPKIFSVGRNWFTFWRSYIEAIPSESTNYWVYFGNGAAYKYTVGLVNFDSFGKLTQLGGTNVIETPAGDTLRYGYTTTFGGINRHFLTSKVDPYGNVTAFDYFVTNNTIRLTSVTDVDNKAVTFEYTTAGNYSNLITKVIAPHGLTNVLQYDSTGRLTNITDTIGLQSRMVYDVSNLTALVTPYGTNTFTFFQNSNQMLALRVYEHGIKNHFFLYQNYIDGAKISSDFSAYVPNTTNAGIFAISNLFDHQTSDRRNSFHWGPRQYETLSDIVRTNLNNGMFEVTNLTGIDYVKARMNHWLKDSTNDWPSLTLSFRREQSPDGTSPGQIRWLDYEGKPLGAPDSEGTNRAPRLMAWRLPNGECRLKYAQRNVLGHPTLLADTYTGEGNTCLLRTNLYEYDSNNVDLTRQMQIQGATTKQVNSNVFNSFHRVITNYNALNAASTFTYNPQQQMLSAKDPNGLTITNTYNSSGAWSNFLAEQIVVELLKTNSMTYSNGYLFTHTDPLRNTRTHFWDSLGRQVKTLYSDGTSVIWAYSNLNVVAVTNRMGQWKQYGYNSFLQKVCRLDARSTNTFTYCSCGTLDSMTDSLNNTTSYVYDNAGRHRATVFPSGYAITNNLDLIGRVTNTIDSTAASVTNCFNNQGMVCVVSNSLGYHQMAKYDIEDRMVAFIGPNNVSSSFAYDALGRPTFHTNGLGTIAVFKYSTLGLIAQTNQMTNWVGYAYDIAGRKIAETNANAEVTLFKYDVAGNLTNLIDPTGNNTFWRYDQYSRVTNKIDATGSIILTYAYDAESRMTNRWTPAKGNTAYSYDSSGNLTNIDYTTSADVAMEYDANSRLVSMRDAIGQTTYSYNDWGGLLIEDGPWFEDSVSYLYGSNRLRSELILLQPNASAWKQSYTYDSANRLSDVATPAGRFSYLYDSEHPLLVRRLNLPGDSYVTNSYDGLGRMLATKLKNNGAAVLNAHAYDYDDGSRRTRQTRTDGDFIDYCYDKAGQLSSALAMESGGTTNRWHERFFYSYALSGNLCKRVHNVQTNVFNANSLNQVSSVVRTNASITIAGTTIGPATNVTVAANGGAASVAIRYADATFVQTNVSALNGTNTFTATAQDSLGRTDTNTVSVYLPTTISLLFDQNGNLRTNGSRIFEYSDENQLTKITEPNAWKSEFLYDGNMRRRVRKEYIWKNDVWLLSSETRYVYDGKLVIQERDGFNIPKTTYCRGLDLSGTLQGAGGTGGLLARVDNNLMLLGDSRATAYYHTDASGNVTCLVDTNQAIVGRYRYDPFGNLLFSSGPRAAANLCRSSSKEVHAPSGLVHYLYRYYDPNLQRWTSRDPIGERGGVNLYSYVFNNPISLWDPLGLCAPCVPNWATGPLGGFTAADINYAARVIYAEASCTSDSDQLAVASVLRNRIGAAGIRGGVQDTFTEVANAPNQFEAVNNNTPKFQNSAAANAPKLSDAECSCLNNAIKNAKIAAAWGSPDFIAPIYRFDSFRAAGPGAPPAGWVRIGGNIFFDDPGIRLK